MSNQPVSAELRVCRKAGCDKPATTAMRQVDPWLMLFEKGVEVEWFCDRCAAACERVGGVRE